jgi:hypothetical protein
MRIAILHDRDTSIKYFIDEYFTDWLKHRGHTVEFTLDNSPETFDFCFFSDSDISARRLLSINPKLKLGLIDPKLNNKTQEENLKLSHFAIVSSIEQSELAFKYNSNIFINHWFRYLKNPKEYDLNREKSNSQLIDIVYHGNKVHLEASHQTLLPALERLAEQFPIRFVVIYNIQKLGIWKRFVPKNLLIKHEQWHPESYLNTISKSDIGVIPSFTPQINGKISYLINKSSLTILDRKTHNINKNDYSIRFKHNSNPGRLHEYAICSLPVVAEATLSMAQSIEHMDNGFLVLGEEGWYVYLKKLILDSECRRIVGKKLHNSFFEKNSIEQSLTNFLFFSKGRQLNF